MIMLNRLAVVLMACTLAGTTWSVLAAEAEKKSDKKSDKAGPLPRSAAKDEKRGAQNQMAPMPRSPAPASGSMPKGAAPRGKLGTEPTARGRLGTDPKPGESSKPPPRLN